MNILWKLTLRTMRKNPKRTIVTIVGIVLATAMLTSVANLAESFIASVIRYEKETYGDFHYAFQGVAPGDLKYFIHNAGVEKVGVSQEVGYGLLEGCVNPDKPYIYVCAMDETCMQMTSLKLTGGRWPKQEDEIVISSHMRSNGGVRIALGDTVTLQMGARDVGEGRTAHQNVPYLGEEEKFVPLEEKTYKVVGVMTRPSYNAEAYESPGYTAVTVRSNDSVENAPESWLTVYALYTKKIIKNRAELNQALKPLAQKMDSNYNLIQWETFRFSERTMGALYGMCGIAIGVILVTSVFCIRNSFQISLTEKLRLYGMLSSVGTTAKQRRKLVLYEACCLGAVGIPLGVGSGALATYLLVVLCGEMVRYAMDMKLVYVFSVPALIVGAVLAVVTIFLSAFRSAGKAAKISPISAIRSQETIRRGRRQLRVPRIITRCFGVGGVLAYKNLRRSHVKYRTTMISIAVSVTAFIATNTFISLGLREAAVQYETREFQLQLVLEDEEREAQADAICAMEEVQDYIQVRRCGITFPAKQVEFTKDYQKMEEMGVRYGITKISDGEPGFAAGIYCLNQRAYEKYCKEQGLTVEEAEKGAIIYAEYHIGIDSGNGMKIYTGTIAEFERGSSLDVIVGKNGENERHISLPVVGQTKVRPEFTGGIFCVVSEEWMKENLEEFADPRMDVYLKCSDVDALERRIRSEGALYSYYLYNYERSMKEAKNMWLFFAIFLYGFITVIALIGVTNIFNTITTNMELRSREFAMLKSVGMTDREFRRMIRLESILYGGEALMIGIPIGCVLSYLFYRILDQMESIGYRLPVSGILICVVAVAALLAAITRYSMAKINRKNIIETIQNENI